MKRSIMKLTGLGIGLSLIALTPACGGLQGRAETPSSATGAVSVNVKLDLPNVGNPKYDAFFNDVIALEQLVADARDALENAPATLNKAMNVAEATDFETAVTNISGKLKGKVTVTINVSPIGADVNMVAAPGVKLSPDEQAMMDAYKSVVTTVATIPMKLEPVVPKSIDIVKQAVLLVASAKSDFTGIKVITTLPSVINGIRKVTIAMGEIKTEVPVVIEKSKTMTVAIQGAVYASTADGHDLWHVSNAMFEATHRLF
jgi:hypothetical protein